MLVRPLARFVMQTTVATVALIALAMLHSQGVAMAAERTVSPEMFGARGDGSMDDTISLQRALDSLSPGDTLRLGSGRTYRHTDVLTMRVPDVRITGSGTLLATEESRSAVVLAADRVLVDGGVTLRMGPTTGRWAAYEQMKLRIAGHDGVTVRDVVVDGAAAAGIYIGNGAANFQVENVRIQDTRADGIHITGAAHDGIVRGAIVDRSGDDGVAVVSYDNDPAPVQRILVETATVRDNTWGRGVSVVGGEDITFRTVTVRRSNAAAIYVAAEGFPFYTRAPERVTVEGAVLTGSNVNPAVDHGAILVYSGREESRPSEIVLSGIDVRGTRRTAPFQIGIIAGPADVDDVRFDRVSIAGGGRAFWANVDPDGYHRTGWTIDGVAIDDQ